MKKTQIAKTLVLAYMTFLVVCPFATGAMARETVDLEVGALDLVDHITVSKLVKGGNVKVDMESNLNVVLTVAVTVNEVDNPLDMSSDDVELYQSDSGEVEASMSEEIPQDGYLLIYVTFADLLNLTEKATVSVSYFVTDPIPWLWIIIGIAVVVVIVIICVVKKKR